MRPERLSDLGVKRLGGEEWNGHNGEHTDGRFYVYRDYKGFLTIGIGHLVKPGEDWSKGLMLDEVIALFHRDLGNVYTAIREGVTFDYNQAQFDSMVCTGHNCGPGFFIPSECTAVRLLNAKDVEGYCTHLLDWNKSGRPPVVDPILTARRQREAAWFREVRTDGGGFSGPQLLTSAERGRLLDQVAIGLSQMYQPERSPSPDPLDAA